MTEASLPTVSARVTPRLPRAVLHRVVNDARERTEMMELRERGSFVKTFTCTFDITSL